MTLPLRCSSTDAPRGYLLLPGSVSGPENAFYYLRELHICRKAGWFLEVRFGAQPPNRGAICFGSGGGKDDYRRTVTRRTTPKFSQDLDAANPR